MTEIKLSDRTWTQIVDYYFDHVHWSSYNQLMPDQRCLTPSMWVRRVWGGDVDHSQRIISFTDSQRAVWFSLHWS